MFGSLDISASALTAQRTRMESIASNIANFGSPRGEFGEVLRDEQGRNIPYRRQVVDFQPVNLGDGRIGVEVGKVRRDMSDFKRMSEPGNKEFADKDGFVYYPNVDLATETVDAMEANRAYEANITAIETTKSMLNATLRIIG